MRAYEQPERESFIFLRDGEHECVSYSYGQLDLKAKAIASLLQDRRALGERGLLLFPAGMDFIAAFFGCMYAGTIAIPCALPSLFHLSRTLSKLQGIIADATPSLLLTTGEIMAKSKQFMSNVADLTKMHFIATDEVGTELASNWRDPHVPGDTISYLQYTSGSTTTPKGVMVAHENVLHNARCYKDKFQLSSETIGVTWLPTFHDLGLMEAVLQPLFSGYKSYFMSPLSFVQRPARWLQAITRHEGTHSAAPNFALDICVDQITADQKSTLNLSRWISCVIGAEPLRLASIERFARAFAPCGLRATTLKPSYGLAEATLLVSGTEINEGPTCCSVDATSLEQNTILDAFSEKGKASSAVRTIIDCGTPPADIKVIISNPATRRECGPCEVGEIWVSSPSVAMGYWNQPQETFNVFHASLSSGSVAPFLRTGDLGFFKQGHLYITGRLKDVIIIDGRNHYPQDIERVVEDSHPAIRRNNSVAFSIDVDGYERLVVVAEIDRKYKPVTQVPPPADSRTTKYISAASVAVAIRHAVTAEFDIDVHSTLLFRPATIPKTSSGKIQRRACRRAFLENRFASAIWDQAGTRPDLRQLAGPEPECT
jgi:acyl-CoA synthetase (AMP-forming)/AMP-acid ligase II